MFWLEIASRAIAKPLGRGGAWTQACDHRTNRKRSPPRGADHPRRRRDVRRDGSAGRSGVRDNPPSTREVRPGGGDRRRAVDVRRLTRGSEWYRWADQARNSCDVRPQCGDVRRGARDRPLKYEGRGHTGRARRRQHASHWFCRVSKRLRSVPQRSDAERKRTGPRDLAAAMACAIWTSVILTGTRQGELRPAVLSLERRNHAPPGGPDGRPLGRGKHLNRVGPAPWALGKRDETAAKGARNLTGESTGLRVTAG